MMSVRSILVSATTAVALAGLVPLSVAPAASAAKAPRGTAVKAPTVAPAPTSLTWYLIRPDLAQGLVGPKTQYLEYQLLTGPGVTASAPVQRSIAGTVSLSRLQASSTYTLRVRNIAVGATPSAWRTFSVTTAAEFAARPPAPRDVRIVASTAQTVTVAWDAPNANTYFYEASIGSTPLLLTGPYAFEMLQRTFTRPAAGQVATFSVAARDLDYNLSLPATLTITG